MIDVLVLTSVWRRPLVSAFHFKWMTHFQTDCEELGIRIKPFYLLSADDSRLSKHKERLDAEGHKHRTLPRSRLSVKCQDGLMAAKRDIEFDWLMHLDSDEILSMGLMERWREAMDNKLWFGSANCWFVNYRTTQAYQFLGYKDHPVKNGGTCLHRQILEHIDWELWPIQRSKGLNIMERRRVEEYGYQLHPIDTEDCYGVVEIKGTGEEIHSLRWFRRHNLLRELEDKERKELVYHHPLLELFI